ncbi:MAG: dTMP kinase [Actinobacteria bacterium]|nr:dTMP kinase [Actinomycetota bacterium]
MATTADQIAALRGQKPARLGDLLKHPQFSRLLRALAVSSLGDWVGFVAVAALVVQLGKRSGSGGAEFAVAGVMAARLLPSVLFGPLAGVLIDRYDRKRLMMVADLTRGAMYATMPFLGRLWMIYLLSFVIECFSLLWTPAKDASLPNMVPKRQLQNANVINLALTYGTLPLGGILYTALVALSGAVSGEGGYLSSNPAFLPLWLDGATFFFSAFMVSRLALRAPGGKARSESFRVGEAFTELREGLRFMREHTLARAMLIGIVMAFTGAGSVMSVGPIFADKVLHSETAWGVLVTSLGVGMGVGMGALNVVNRYLEKETLFSAAMLATGVAGIVLPLMPSVASTAVLTGVVGAFAGMTWVTGYTILQENISDEFRGRTFGTLTTLARLGLFLSLAGFPVLAGIVGDHRLPFTDVRIRGAQVSLAVGGLVVLLAGVASRRGLKRSRIARPRALNLHLRLRKAPPKGLFIAFEGVEGAGKGTQIRLVEEWLGDEGRSVLVTREPGGTELGERLRDAVLSKDHPVVDARAEALVFAASRAQHVVSVIRPALAEGRVVLCDRYVDSSLAYQGVARGLGEQDILQLNAWATQGLFPDLVVLLHLEPEKGLSRKTEEGDRFESEDEEFHAKVADAYLHLAEEHPERFAVIDADATPDVVHERVREAIRPFLEERDAEAAEEAAAAEDPKP